jgi:hypothetical protein
MLQLQELVHRGNNMLYTDTHQCKSKINCIPCRSFPTFRKQIATMFELPDDNINFKCPYGENFKDNNQNNFINADYIEIRKFIEPSPLIDPPLQPRIIDNLDCSDETAWRKLQENIIILNCKELIDALNAHNNSIEIRNDLSQCQKNARRKIILSYYNSVKDKLEKGEL